MSRRTRAPNRIASKVPGPALPSVWTCGLLGSRTSHSLLLAFGESLCVPRECPPFAGVLELVVVMVLLLGPFSVRAGGQHVGRPCASGAQRHVFERILLICEEGHREVKRSEGSGRRKRREEEEGMNSTREGPAARRVGGALGRPGHSSFVLCMITLVHGPSQACDESRTL